MKKIILILILTISIAYSKNFAIDISWHPLTNSSYLISYGLDYRITTNLFIGLTYDYYKNQSLIQQIEYITMYDTVERGTVGFRFRIEF